LFGYVAIPSENRGDSHCPTASIAENDYITTMSN